MSASLLTPQQYIIAEKALYFFLIYICTGSILHSLCKHYVYAIEPKAKKRANYNDLDTPVRLMLANARMVAWLLALLIPSIILEVNWFVGLLGITIKTSLFLFVVSAILYIVCFFDKSIQKNLLSVFGYWYICYHLKVGKMEKLTLHFKDGSTVIVKDIFLLHTTGSKEREKEILTFSNADLMRDCFGFGIPKEDDFSLPETIEVQE